MDSFLRRPILTKAASVILAIATLGSWAGSCQANSKHVVIEFAAGSGSVVTDAGDAWFATSDPADCDLANPPVEASCGIDFTSAPSTGNTTAEIPLGFDINIGGVSYHSLYINRYGYVTFGHPPTDGTFTFVSDLAGLQGLLVDSTNAAIPFIAPFHANLTVPDGAFSHYAPFGGGASYFRGKGDPIAPFSAAEVLPAFAVTWFNDDSVAPSVVTQLVIYQKNTSGDFYLTLRYRERDTDAAYDISSTSALPAVAGFSLTSAAEDQVSLAGPLPGPDGYFYEFVSGHLNSTPPLTLACPAATAQVGTAYSSSLAATGGAPPVTYFVAGGSLPSGLSLTATSGAISGTPIASGTYTFTAQATDSSGAAAGTVTKACTITVDPAPAPTLTLTPSSVSFGTVKQYSIAAKAITLTNAGTVPIAISKVSIAPNAGTPARDFAVVSFCGSALAAGKQCKVYVVLFALDPGALGASVNIVDNAAGSPHQVPVTATVVRQTH